MNKHAADDLCDMIEGLASDRGEPRAAVDLAVNGLACAAALLVVITIGVLW